MLRACSHLVFFVCWHFVCVFCICSVCTIRRLENGWCALASLKAAISWMSPQGKRQTWHRALYPQGKYLYLYFMNGHQEADDTHVSLSLSLCTQGTKKNVNIFVFVFQVTTHSLNMGRGIWLTWLLYLFFCQCFQRAALANSNTICMQKLLCLDG